MSYAKWHKAAHTWCALLPPRIVGFVGASILVRRSDGKFQEVRLVSLWGHKAGCEIWRVERVRAIPRYSIEDVRVSLNERGEYVVQPAVQTQEEQQMACADKTYMVQGLTATGANTGTYTHDNTGKALDSLEKAQEFAANLVGKNRDLQYGPSSAVIFESVAKVEVESKPVKVTKIC